MNKPLKVMSAAALTGILSVSAITPVAAQTVEVPADAKVISEIILKTEDGKLAFLEYADFRQALAKKFVTAEMIEQLTVKESSTYLFSDYKQAFAKQKTVEKALEFLYEKNEQYEDDTPVYEGEIVDGKLVAKVDEQPEDRLNETFFYNVA